MDYIGTHIGLYRDNGKENSNYNSNLGFRVQGLNSLKGLYRGLPITNGGTRSLDYSSCGF